MGSSSAQPPGAGSSSHGSGHELPRRAFIGGAAAAATPAPLGSGLMRPAAPSARLPPPGSPRSVPGAPPLPAGFTDTFTSRFVHAGGIRQHAVIGGDGPPLLLVHGWPENWYAWRL